MADLSASNAQPSAALAPPLCYFTDKLSPETRVLIYEYVFGPKRFVARLWSDEDADSESSDQEDEEEEWKMLHTDILATNKFVCAEALDTFHRVKVFRTSFPGLCRLMRLENHANLVRNMELKYCEELIGSPMVLETVQNAQCLPQLKSLTILADHLSPFAHVPITVRAFAEACCLGEVVCTAVGVYTVTGRHSKVTIIHGDILVMWPTVASTPTEYDALEEVNNILAWWNITNAPCHRMDVGYEAKLIPWASHTSLRLWVALAQRCLYLTTPTGITGVHPECSKDEDTKLTWFTSSLETNLREKVFDGLSTPLQKLGPGSDPHILEVFTEWLAVNVRNYWEGNMDHGFEATKPQWVELGEGSKGEEVSTRQRLAEQQWISQPFDRNSMVHIDTVRYFLGICERLRNMAGTKVINHAPKTVLQQVYYLCTAGDLLEYQRHIDRSPNEQAEFDKWCLGLLRKYVQAAGIAESSNLHGASLARLRATFRFAVSTSSARKEYWQEVRGLDTYREMKGVDSTSHSETPAATAQQSDEASGDGEDGGSVGVDGDEDNKYEGLLYMPFVLELGQLIKEIQTHE